MTRDSQALAALALTLMVAFAAIAVLVTSSSRRAELVGRGAGAGGDERFAGLTQAMDARLRRSKQGRKLAQWLGACGSPVGPAEFILIVLAAAAVGFLFLLLFIPWLPALVVTTVIALLAARGWGEKRRNQRSEAFIQQLPELSRTLSNGSSAGLSMAGAVSLAAREISDPARTELGTVVEELRLGRPIDEALDMLGERLPSREVSVLVTTLVIQQRSGGDTVKALGELADTLEARKDLRREVKTLLSGTVYTSYIIAAMGVGTLLLMNVISPGVLRDMSSSPIGIAAFVVAGILWAAGFIMIRNTTKIDL